MPTITLVDSGYDHLYPDGVEIHESTVSLSDLIKRVARVSSLAVNADPFFANHSNAQKIFSELHGESDRITDDFIEEAVKDLLPVFASKQRWLVADGTYEPYTYTAGTSVVYRWENHDTRGDYKQDYSVITIEDRRPDPNYKQNVDKYSFEAIKDFVLAELYRAIGYDKKYIDFKRSYEQNRQQVAYWLKRDTSRQTQYHHGGV